MSSISVMGLTSAIFISELVAGFWLVGKMNDEGVIVYTGVVQGMPIPTKERWLRLYQAWTMYALAITTSAAAVGFAIFHIAQHAADADAKSVAYLYAFILFVGSFGNLVTGISAFLSYASVVRQAEAH
jgi:hypothetical protein